MATLKRAREARGEKRRNKRSIRDKRFAKAKERQTTIHAESVASQYSVSP
jgi:hypothetical protein